MAEKKTITFDYDEVQKAYEKMTLINQDALELLKNLKTTSDDAIEKINSINFVNQAISNEFPIAELHWIIADKKKSITVEKVKDGIKIYDNPVGVLTNNPETSNFVPRGQLQVSSTSRLP